MSRLAPVTDCEIAKATSAGHRATCIASRVGESVTAHYFWVDVVGALSSAHVLTLIADIIINKIVRSLRLSVSLLFFSIFNLRLVRDGDE